MRILVPVEELEPVPTKTWPAPKPQPKPAAAAPHPVQPTKASSPERKPAPPRPVTTRQPAPAHPTAAVAKTTQDKQARVTDVSSGTGYDIATGERLAEAKVAATMPIGLKHLASAPLPIRVEVTNAPSHGKGSPPSLKSISEALTIITVAGDVVAVAFPPAAEVALPIAEGAQLLNTAIETYDVARHPTTGGRVVLVTDATLLLGGRLAPKVPALSTPKAKQTTRVVVLASDLSVITGTTIKKEPHRSQHDRPSLRPGP